MRRKRQETQGVIVGEQSQGESAPVSDSAPASFTQNENSQSSGGASYGTPGADESPKPKLAIPLNDRGGFDRDGMRAGTLAKLDRAISLEPRALVSSEIKPSDIRYLYNLLGGLETFVWAKYFKVPDDVAEELCRYTEDDLDALVPTTKEVLAKYNITDLAYLPEAKLVITLSAIQWRKMMSIRVTMAIREKAAREAEVLRRSSAPSESGAVTAAA